VIEKLMLFYRENEKMEKYNIINYRLKASVKPIDVLRELEQLLKKHNATYLENLLNLEVPFIEIEYSGKLHSNRRQRNAILTILKHHPELNAFFEDKKQDSEDGFTKEVLTIRNYSEQSLLSCGNADFSLIKQIAEKIPKPYSVNRLEIIFNGIGFDKTITQHCVMKPSHSGFDSPVGNYISYSREKYGDEKHSYIQFSANDESLESMRSLFFDFSEAIAGKYEGTEYHE
jgi:hypothetical protein